MSDSPIQNDDTKEDELFDLDGKQKQEEPENKADGMTRKEQWEDEPGNVVGKCGSSGNDVQVRCTETVRQSATYVLGDFETGDIGDWLDGGVDAETDDIDIDEYECGCGHITYNWEEMKDHLTEEDDE